MPLTVMLYVPAATVEAIAIDIAELPVPVIDAGLKLTVTPEGWPDADSDTGDLKLPVVVLTIVALLELPAATESLVGSALTANPAVPALASALNRPVPLGLPQPVARS